MLDFSPLSLMLTKQMNAEVFLKPLFENPNLGGSLPLSQRLLIRSFTQLCGVADLRAARDRCLRLLLPPPSQLQGFPDLSGSPNPPILGFSIFSNPNYSTSLELWSRLCDCCSHTAWRERDGDVGDWWRRQWGAAMLVRWFWFNSLTPNNG